MIAIKHEIDSVQLVKDEIDDIRESLDRLEAESQRRKNKLLEQVHLKGRNIQIKTFFFLGLNFFLGLQYFLSSVRNASVWLQYGCHQCSRTGQEREEDILAL